MSTLNRDKSQFIKKFWLPSTASLPEDDPQKDWVTMDTGSMLAGDLAAVEESDLGLKSLVVLQRRILDWSFTEPSGEKAPITVENVACILRGDFIYLCGQIQDNAVQAGLTPEQKKT